MVGLQLHGCEDELLCAVIVDESITVNQLTGNRIISMLIQFQRQLSVSNTFLFVFILIKLGNFLC